MPMYEYVCEKCGLRFEHYQPTSSTPPPKCPKCKHEETRKQVSAPARTPNKWGETK